MASKREKVKRSGKFYYRNEKEVMEQLGLQQTRGSGNGWVEKEDGQSEEVICQLKSTDSSSIKVHKKDVDTLLYNAEVCHKVPVFAIQFLQAGDTYLLVKPEDLVDVAGYIQTGKMQTRESFLGVSYPTGITPLLSKDIVPTVKSSKIARKEYAREQEEKFKNIKKSRSAF